MDEVFFRKYCDLMARVAPFRKSADAEIIKTVGHITALANRAEELTHGKNESRFEWSDSLSHTTDSLYLRALGLLQALERGEQPLKGRFAEPGGRMWDHSIVIRDGLVHIFYTGASVAYNWPERFTDTVGHAVSRDLLHWEILPPVITAEKGGHDSHQVWAPGVFSWNGRWWMFYTGVNYEISQCHCLAVSDDLYTWEKIDPRPLMIPPAWTGWKKDQWSDCRDDMVFADDDGRMYLYYCTTHFDEQGQRRTAVGMMSSREPYHWQDEGWLTLEGCKMAPESPYVIKRNGLYYLFYTNCEHFGTCYACSEHPLTGWREVGMLIPGACCTEAFCLNGQWYLSACEEGMIGFYEMLWQDDGTVKVGSRLK